MKAKKTIKVETLKTITNHQLSSDISQQEKGCLCTLLERVLHDTGNYQGFNYNFWNNGGHKEWKKAGEPDFPKKEVYITGPDKDEYGREYY